jgi:hypothetical protein
VIKTGKKKNRCLHLTMKNENGIMSSEIKSWRRGGGGVEACNVSAVVKSGLHFTICLAYFIAETGATWILKINFKF